MLAQELVQAELQTGQMQRIPSRQEKRTRIARDPSLVLSAMETARETRSAPRSRSKMWWRARRVESPGWGGRKMPRRMLGTRDQTNSPWIPRRMRLDRPPMLQGNQLRDCHLHY